MSQNLLFPSFVILAVTIITLIVVVLVCGGNPPHTTSASLMSPAKFEKMPATKTNGEEKITQLSFPIPITQKQQFSDITAHPTNVISSQLESSKEKVRSVESARGGDSPSASKPPKSETAPGHGSSPNDQKQISLNSKKSDPIQKVPPENSLSVNPSSALPQNSARARYNFHGQSRMHFSPGMPTSSG